MKSDKKIDTELGRLFKNQREKLGFSQGKVCKTLGYSTPQFLSNFERGLCSMPLEKLGRMIEMYKMDGEKVVRLMTDLQCKFLRSQLVKSPRARIKPK